MKNILVVEDDSSLSSALSKKLVVEGYNVEVAKNGLEGLEQLKVDHFDLILLDVMMPEMDGITMLKKVRSSGKNKDIPVILISNVDDPDIIIKTLSLGSFDYLVKSDWTIKDIVAKVRGRIGN